MGVQTFVDEELNSIKRRHTAQQAIDAVHIAKMHGFSNISIDLIFGIPGQTLDSWKYSLQKAIELDVPHISAYSLGYEPGTALFKLRELGKVKEVDEEVSLAMFDSLIDTMQKHGYSHYEVSNFAKPGWEAKHNSSYWEKVPYLGLGVSAHSYDGEVRRFNIYNLKQYMQLIHSKKPAYETERLKWWERYDEDVMIRLRTSKGLPLSVLQQYDEDAVQHFVKKANRFIAEGVMSEDGNTYRLTRKGIMVSDSIIRDLMWDH